MTRSKTTWTAVILALLALAALSASSAHADHVVMRDGTEHVGKILSSNDKFLRVRMATDGITSVVNIPRADVDWIERDNIVTMEPSPPRTLPTSPTPATTPARTLSTPTTSTTPPRPASDGHLFHDMLALLTGRSPDLTSPDTLPPMQRGLWEDVVIAEASGRKDQLLAALTTLANADIKPPSRLDSLAWRFRGKFYGTWLAETRWACVAARYRSGQFDLRNVTDIEKPALIGILRANTPPALNPLRLYFPPPPASVAAAAVPHPGAAPPPSPLAGITARNALEVKDRALYASAVLLAQLRLEPDMPTIDRIFLSRELGYVRDALARALDLEPAARALKDREEQDRELAAERARQNAARNPPSPHP